MTEAVIVPAATKASGERRFLGALGRSAKGLTGLFLIAIVVLCAIFATSLVPHDHAQQVIEWRYAPVVWQDGGSTTNLLGGDNMGRDILSRTIMGAQVSIQVALIVVSIALVVGSTLGALAGYFGGFVDTIIMRIVDFQLAFPFLLLALIFMAVLGAGFATLVMALAFALWINFARIVRSETMRIRTLDYVDAAITMGVSQMRIIFTHVLPNVLPAVLVVATLDIALVIISEAALSFLGLGVQPPTASWGVMISEGRDFLYEQPWIVIAPGIAVLISSVGINLFGDFLRDYFDPRLERM
ncbi:ABC-type dipeptide/oligopeptide/nickel transport system permease subunit [Aminobacter lissarensis]|uniref:ABC-type dipeptide/oligopeptide/nickel transport system permease subunit n=1 Tax=Aminobacter carboxidus TaxID=376165 RepID=A0A8E2BEQ3_9HYPH|nr:ABC transporter permease [Aminobacter lissarensis]MBB6467110.1 ABC-type dipeptide/oligopeptide/nickel transport system permease subunit [Aminobacter lissarensis]